MSMESKLKQTLTDLLSKQKVAVVATSNDGQPYTSLVAFVVTDDLRTLYFVTPQTTRKYSNISSDPRIAAMIDNRLNKDADIHNAIGATITGVSRILNGKEAEKPLELYHVKHPYMKEFSASPTSVLIEVKIDKYYIVSHFQKVVELHVDSTFHG